MAGRSNRDGSRQKADREAKRYLKQQTKERTKRDKAQKAPERVASPSSGAASKERE
jgi:hypothetical protein